MDRVTHLGRWQPICSNILAHPRIMAMALGLLAALGFPPVGLWPAALLAIGGLVWLIRRAPTAKAAATLGWLFGAAHFTLANNWIATAFTFQAEMPAVVGWAAVPLLSLYLAIYPALACAAGHRLGRESSFLIGGIGFAACWTVAEWLRSWVFSGYAWDPLGLILLGPFDRPGLAALLPWMGTYALSGLAIVLGIGLLALIRERRPLPLFLMAALLGFGMYLPAPESKEGTLPFTLIQPNLAQDELNDAAQFENQFQRIAKLSARSGPAQNVNDTRRLVLWPESGVPDYLRDGYPQRYYDRMTVAGDPAFARYRIGRTIGQGGVLLTGAVDLEIENGRASGARNVVTAIREDGVITGSYAKAHLVPGGEYLPLRGLLEPLGASRLVAGSLDFLPGPGPQTLSLGPWGKAGVQICYEIVFSGQVADRANRPDYIFNPSNDGWFGSWGPPQHLGQARMRAIEEGLPVLRATTTGISAVIDANGVVRAHIGMQKADRIDGMVPPAHTPTWFGRLGNFLPMMWAFAALLGSLVATRLRPR